MAPVGLLTLLHLTASGPPVAVLIASHELCRCGVVSVCWTCPQSMLRSSPRNDGFDSAWVYRVALMHREPPGERPSHVFAREAPSNSGPESLQSRRRHAHAPHAV